LTSFDDACAIGSDAETESGPVGERRGLMTSPAWTLEFYEEDGHEPVLDFLRGLDEFKEQALAAALRNVLAYEGIGVCGSSWGKWVQGAPGIFEFRVRHDAATILRERRLPAPEHLKATSADILLRVFCHAHGKKIVLLLAGYDKGKEPSSKRQNAEIKRAKQRLTRWRAQQQVSGKQAGDRHLSRGKRP
jgi:hypothetical protein